MEMSSAEAAPEVLPPAVIGDAFGTGSGRGGVGGTGGGVGTQSAPAYPTAIGAAAGASLSSGPRSRTKSNPYGNRQIQLSSDDPSQQPMIIRTGVATVEVDSLERAIAQVTQLAQRLGGHVASSSSETGRKDFRTAQLTLRLPAAQFDAALSGLNPIGKIESQNVGSEDVTEQFVDMTARMTNAKRLEERLINLLANRTGKLEEVLAVERELARVREEIERYEGRLRYLRTRAAVSTLSINLHEPYPITEGPRGSNPVAEAFKRAWRNFIRLLANTIASLGVIIPVALVVLMLGWILRRYGLLPRFRRVRDETPSRTRDDTLDPPAA